jgi:two-component system KDP operon response regulator KdpE
MTLSPTRAASPPAVLVADDDDVVRGSVSEILRHEGYAVTEAGDGDAALRLLGRDRFDVLVLDNHLLRLEGMAGLASVPNPPPAVLMSGIDLDPGGRKDLAVRGIAYLRKPVEPEHLLDAVATAMGRARHS